MIRRLEVVLKVAERCNINCSYCYVFNQNDDAYLRHPALMSRDAVLGTARFLGEAARHYGLREIKVDFHGGEPTLIGPERYLAACQTFRSEVPSDCKVSYSIQTNAMLIDDEWLEILSSTRTRVGVSVDGPPDTHDKHRVDHHGHGTYDRTIVGLRRLQEVAQADRGFWGPGIICVIDPQSDARAIFRHFTEELRVSALHYLLPDASHMSVLKPSTSQVTEYLRNLLDAWLPVRATVQLRFLTYLFALLQQGEAGQIRARDARSEYAAITVASSGDLGPDDSWRTAVPELFATGMNTSNTTLHDFLNDPRISPLRASSGLLASQCTECCWKHICRSGNFLGSLHRYAGAAMFDRPSLYCSSIQSLMTNAVEALVRQGLPFARIEAALAMHEAVG